jgi:hypothetical protein
MRYLQVMATFVCVLLAVIAWQLHGMRPFTRADYDKMAEDGVPYEEFAKRFPMVWIRD